MPDELAPEICVIGGGPGGIALSVAAANQGLSVVLVEKTGLGGANLREGGVPAAALRAAADLHEALRRGPAFGVSGAPLQVNTAKVQEHIRSVVDAAAGNVSRARLEAFGVTVVAGEARFADRRTVVTGEATIRARNFVVATGSVPVLPGYNGLDSIETVDTATVLDAGRKPAHLIILGATPRGLELAQSLNRLGIDASVIDGGPALADEDAELAAPVLDRLRAEGIRIRERAGIVGFARRKGGVRVTVRDDGEETVVDGSHLLVATPRGPDVEALDLGAAGIEHGPSGIVVDKRLRTTNKRVFAIGDAVGGAPSANRAEHHAARVLAAIAGTPGGSESDAGVPFVVHTDPGLARVGLSEAEARVRNRLVRVLRVPFAENDRSQAERATAGFVKVIASDRGRILGAGVTGREAGEQIALWALVLSAGLGIDDLRSFPAPYPSRAEIARRVAIAFDGPGRAPLRRTGALAFLRRSG
jgi:pyruvate/2-oxoglutarate dehydrogenase complex dihydrolipoamide dehydrogenase (E3) component